MARKGFREVQGVKVKIRTEDVFVVATLWIDNRLIHEIARIHKSYVAPDGSVQFHRWHDLVQSLFEANVSRIVKSEVKTFRRRADYSGEERRPGGDSNGE